MGSICLNATAKLSAYAYAYYTIADIGQIRHFIQIFICYRHLKTYSRLRCARPLLLCFEKLYYEIVSQNTHVDMPYAILIYIYAFIIISHFPYTLI